MIFALVVGQGSAVAGMGLSGETIAMLWSMRERDITNSKFAPFFGALPETFNTGRAGVQVERLFEAHVNEWFRKVTVEALDTAGLSLGFRGLQALQGTLLLQEILQAKEVCMCSVSVEECYPSLSQLRCQHESADSHLVLLNSISSLSMILSFQN